MKKFVVKMTRDITESVSIEVEAETADDAEDRAYTVMMETDNLTWEVDDGSADGIAYASDVTEVGDKT